MQSANKTNYRSALQITENVLAARGEAVTKAWDSLARYKFEMFGYWASAFVKYNQLLPKELKVANPFRDAVHLARSKRQEKPSWIFSSAEKSPYLRLPDFGTVVSLVDGTPFCVEINDYDRNVKDGTLACVSWIEITFPGGQKFLDAINRYFNTKFEEAQFAGR